MSLNISRIPRVRVITCIYGTTDTDKRTNGESLHVCNARQRERVCHTTEPTFRRRRYETLSEYIDRLKTYLPKRQKINLMRKMYIARAINALESAPVKKRYRLSDIRLYSNREFLDTLMKKYFITEHPGSRLERWFS